MALAMRLTRGGRKNTPYYRIVVADKRYPRDGRFLEKLGTYNPLLEKGKRVTLNEERIKHWLSQGAQPSYRVSVFLGEAGIAPMPEKRNNPQKGQPSEKTKMRITEKEEKRAKAAEAAKAAEEEAKAAAAAAAAAPAETPAEAEAPVADAAPAEEPKAE